MAAFVKYNSFAVNLAINTFVLTTGGSALKIALSNTAGDVAPAGHTQLSTITQIAYTNITETVPALVTGVGSETPAGTWDMAGTDIVLNATGAVATFQYVILFDDTATNDELIGSWDYGSGVTLANGESFTVDFGASIFTIT